MKNMKITENFNIKEFDSHDGSKMPKNVFENILELADNLQVLRDHIGKPIHINSGYRSPTHNAKVGGVKDSRHIFGQAADIRIEGYSSAEIALIIYNLISKGEMKQGGVGIYNTFVHYDIRGTRARWDNRK